MSTNSVVGGQEVNLEAVTSSTNEPEDRAMEFIFRTMVASGLGAMWAFFTVTTLVLDFFIGPKWFDLYMSPTLGFIYWIDIVPHFLAGVSIGLFIMVFKVVVDGTDMEPISKLYFYGILLSLTVGILWEWYEVASGLARCEINCGEIVLGLSYFHFNQIKDLLVDCLGTVVTIYGWSWFFSRI